MPKLVQRLIIFFIGMPVVLALVIPPYFNHLSLHVLLILFSFLLMLLLVGCGFNYHTSDISRNQVYYGQTVVDLFDNFGAILLPMHIAVLIAALTFGTLSATIVGISSVLFSFLLTGMPALARLPYMAIELVIYSVLVGLLSKKFNNYISLFISMVVGRIIYAGVLISANILGFTTYGVSVIESTKIGLVGIILQLLFFILLLQIFRLRYFYIYKYF